MSRKKKHVDYYQVLGVSRDATDEDIKKGYRKQALRWHPDKNHGDVENAAEQFKVVSEAYQVLSDRRRRQIYDLKGCNVGEAGAFTEEDAAAAAAAFDINAFSSPADIYRQFFPEDAGFADLLDSLDYGKKKTRKHDVNDFNAGDAGAFAYGGTAAGAYDFNSFLSPADLYRQFFPEDKGFADFLDSFGQNGPQQAGSDRPTDDTASRDSDRSKQAEEDQTKEDSNSSERNQQQQPGNDQHRKTSTSSERGRSQPAECDQTWKRSNDSDRAVQRRTGDNNVPETKAGAQHPERTGIWETVKNVSRKCIQVLGSLKDSQQGDAAEANQNADSYIEHARALLDKRGAVYQRYDDAISKFMANKNSDALASQRKEIDADHKQVTQQITHIQSVVKPLAPEAADKLSKLQKLDERMKDHLNNAMSLAQKLVRGSMEKQQYVTAEKELSSQKNDLLCKIDSVLASLYSH